MQKLNAVAMGSASIVIRVISQSLILIGLSLNNIKL